MQRRQIWLYTAALLIMMIYMAMVHQLRSALLTDMINFYGLTDSVQGLPASAISVGSLIAMLLAIFLMGRIPKPLLLALSSAAAAALLIPQYFVPAFAAFIALNFISGLALGVMDPLISSCMADVHTGRRAALMMSLLHASYGVGGIVAPSAYGMLLDTGMEWNLLFLIVAALGGVVMLYAFPVSLRQCRVPAETALSSSARLSISVVRAYFSDRVLAAFTGIMFCFGLFFGGMTTWIIRFVNVTYDSALGNTVLSLVFLGITIGRIAVPLMPIGEGRFLKIAGFGAGMVMFIALIAGSDIVTAICGCIACILAGPIVPYALSIACGRNRMDSLMVSTMLNLALYIGQTIVTPIMGAIEGASGLTYSMAFCYIFAAGCSVFAALGLRSRGGNTK